MCAKRRKGNRENTPAIKHHNDKHVTDPLKKANSLNYNYASLFTCECNNLQIQSTQSGKHFIININIIRKQLSAFGRKKYVGPDGIPGEILNLSEEAMIRYLATLLDITVNNSAIAGDWKELQWFTFRKREIDRYLQNVDQSA